MGWIDRVRNKEVLHRGKEERNILYTIDRRKANWIGHILSTNCLLHVIEEQEGERVKVTGIRRRRRKQLLENLNEMRRYWEVNAEALDRTLWRTKRLCTCKTDYRMTDDSFLSPIHIYKIIVLEKFCDWLIFPIQLIVAVRLYLQEMEIS